MTSRARKLLEEAIRLPVEERASLVAELLATLPPESAEDLHPAWAVELERRARRAWEDPDGGQAWEDVERRLLERFGR